MPLPAPILDDRSYEEIRRELVRRIPVHNPEWTDHNASDPGITLLELFAFLGENVLFRFNQIPEATRLAFLRLLDIQRRPATPARGLLTATTRKPEGVLLGNGTETLAGDVSFETQVEAYVLPLESVGVARLRSRTPESPEEHDQAEAVLRALEERGSEGTPTYYTNALLPEEPSAPEAEPVDFSGTVDGYLWVAVLSTKDTDPDALAGRVLNLGFLPEQESPTMDEVLPCPGPGDETPSPSMVWQGSTGEVRNGEPRYANLKVVGDTTAGLTRTGVIRVQLPDDPTELAPFAQDDPELAGTGAMPPVLEDDDVTERVLFWLRVGRTREEPMPGRVRWVGVNATEILQARSARPEFLGTGDGQPGQEMDLVHHPVLADTLELEVEEGDRWVAWAEVDGFEASGRDDRHYLLDRTAGTVRFGNGIRGRPPQIGERVRAVGYGYGGGRSGNVAAKAVSALPSPPGVKVQNPWRTSGGADDETLEEALQRIPGEIRRKDRAVTPGDFRELALQTPGADLGRAEILPLFHPPTREENAAGVVTLVVWPKEDLEHPDAPTPTRSTLRRVCAWIDQRRLVTTETWVVPPTYRKVAVSVGVEVKSGYGVEAVRRWVELALRQYLAPLPPYGPEGDGWPLGHRVYGPELEAAALQVEGVAFLVGDLRVAHWEDGDGSDEGSWVEDGRTVTLRAWEVPELAEITVVEGEPLEPGQAVGSPPPVEPALPVPLPVIQAEC